MSLNPPCDSQEIKEEPKDDKNLSPEAKNAPDNSNLADEEMKEDTADDNKPNEDQEMIDNSKEKPDVKEEIKEEMKQNNEDTIPSQEENKDEAALPTPEKSIENKTENIKKDTDEGNGIQDEIKIPENKGKIFTNLQQIFSENPA